MHDEISVFIDPFAHEQLDPLFSKEDLKKSPVRLVFKPQQSDLPVILSDLTSPEELLPLFLNSSTNHFLQRSNPWTRVELQTSALMIRSPETFFESPLSAILNPERAGPWAERVFCEFEFVFNKSSQKPKLLEQLSVYLNAISHSSIFVSEASLLVDELFTNSLYNAPYTNSDNSDVGFSRSEGVAEMNFPKVGKISLGRLGDRLVICCEDPYGSLHTHNLLNRVKSCLDLGPDRMMRFETGGAGIGSFLMLMTSTSLFIAVKKNVKTVIAATLPLRISNRKKNEMPKNLHCLEFSE